MPPVSHGNTPLSMAPNLVRHPSESFRCPWNQNAAAGLLLLRHVTPLTRRDVVYFYSGAHKLMVNSRTVPWGVAGTAAISGAAGCVGPRMKLPSASGEGSVPSG